MDDNFRAFLRVPPSTWRRVWERGDYQQRLRLTVALGQLMKLERETACRWISVIDTLGGDMARCHHCGNTSGIGANDEQMEAFEQQHGRCRPQDVQFFGDPAAYHWKDE